VLYRVSRDFMLHLLDYITGLMFVWFWHNSPQWARASSFTRFLDHTQRRTTVGRTPLGERSARRKDFYLTTHTTLKTDRHPRPRWDSNPNLSRRAAEDLRLRPRGHWDRPLLVLYEVKNVVLMWARFTAVTNLRNFETRMNNER